MSDKSNGASSNGQRPHVRRFVRAPVSMPVSYVRDGQEEPKLAHSSDLGGGGLRLATDEDLPLGAVLLLRFRLPGEAQELLARARIVLSFYNAEEKRFFHGVAFTQIAPQDQESIVRFIAAEVEKKS